MIEILVLLTAIPVGIFISWLTKEEVVYTKYFGWIAIISILGMTGTWLMGFNAETWAFAYLFILSITSMKIGLNLTKSYKK